MSVPPLSNSFTPTYKKPEESRGRIATTIRLSENFTVIVATCNSKSESEAQMDSIRAENPDLNIRHIELREASESLFEVLQSELISESQPNAVFVSGMEQWIVGDQNPKSVPFILNLNAARNHFAREFSFTLVLWVPEYLYGMIRRGAPDFASVISGAYPFPIPSEIPDAPLEQIPLPTSGTYTLLFTDMEGSSDFAKTLGKGFEPIHDRHNEILDACAAKWKGHIHRRQGDSYFVSFLRASEAASFAIEAMQALENTDWKALNPSVPKLRVRIGMHTGYLTKAPERISDREFMGDPANKAHRVMEAAHGGQILCSETTYREILDSGGKTSNIVLESKGHYNLKGVGATELIQITGEGLQKKFDPAVRAKRFSGAHSEDFDEAEKEYLTGVRNNLDQMELFGADLDQEEKYPLQTAYISLRFQDTPTSAEDFFDRLEPGGALVHIEGDAGSGKSTLLKWLAVKAASGEEKSFSQWRESLPRKRTEEENDEDEEFPEPDLRRRDSLQRDEPTEDVIARYEQLWRFRLPFFIRLRDVVNKESKLSPLPKFLAETFSLDQSLIVERLKEGRCLLLIDGADEVPTGLRPDIWAEIKTVINLYGKKNIIVVSSRPMPGELDWLKSLDATCVKVADLTDPDKLALIQHWYSAIAEKFKDTTSKYHGMDDKGLKERGESLQKELPDNVAAHELAKVPLLCALICALYALREDRPRLPETLPDLCERTCRMLLEKRPTESNVPAASSIDILKDLDYSFKRRIVQRLAVSMMDRGLSELHFKNAAAIVKVELGADRCPKEIDGEKFMQNFIVLCGVLRFGKGDSVEFLHNTLKEFLAADYYYGTQTYQRLLFTPNRLDPTNLLLFVAHNQYHSDEVLRLLLDPSKLFPTKKYTVKQKREAELLFLRCYPLYSKRPDDLAEALSKLKPTFLPPKNEQEAIAVATFGDEIIECLSYDKKMHPTRAASCIQALRHMKVKKSVRSEEALRVYAENETRHPALNAITQFMNPLDVAWVRDRIVNTDLDFEQAYGEGKVYRQRITQKHLKDFLSVFPPEQLVSLILDNTQVSKIEGLENATNLQTLSLSRHTGQQNRGAGERDQPSNA